MNKLKHALIVTVLGAAAVLPAFGGGAPVSPNETISITNGGNLIKITYGRPYSHAPDSTEIRKIWGGLVPWDQPWRLGADQATTLVIQKAIVLGGANVPAGTYTLYMVPSEKGVSKLAICKKTGQWGIPVDVADDLARVDLKKDRRWIIKWTNSHFLLARAPFRIRECWQSTGKKPNIPLTSPTPHKPHNR